MATGNMNAITIKGLARLIVTVLVGVTSYTAMAQSSQSPFDHKIDTRGRMWEDSRKKVRTRRIPVYLGAGVSLSYAQTTLQSRIDRLDKLPLNFLGTNAEGVIGTPAGKLKATAGVFYSGASVPYTVDVYQGGLSGSIYLLRLSKITYHTFEPYFTAGICYQETRVYGSNLIINDRAVSEPINFSTSDPPLAGKVFNTQLNLGAGLEYQLENDQNKFIHLFAEMTYGVPVNCRVSNHAFEGTRNCTPVNISIGAHFGIFK